MNGAREKINFLEYFLVMMLIFVSGNPVFCNLPVFPFFQLVFLFVALLFRRLHFHPKMWLFVISMSVVFFGQYVILGEISILGCLNRLLKVFFGTAVFAFLKEKFRYAYLDVMAVIAAISIVCFTMQVLNIPIPLKFFSFRSPRFFTSLIYNYVIEHHGKLRNAGCFWEPGAYACYLMLIPVLFMDSWQKIVRDCPVRCGLVFVALLTTFSTTGYITLIICIALGIIANSKRKYLVALTIVPLLAFGSYKMYNTLDFLGTKVESQTDDLERETERNEFSNTRFGSLLFDLHYIRKHPVFGNGMIEKTRYADNKELWGVELGHGNGFSNFLAQMGIPIMILYFVLMYRLSPFSRYQRFSNIIILLCLMQGEQLFNYPLIISFPFVIINEAFLQERFRREKMERSRRYLYRSLRG